MRSSSVSARVAVFFGALAVLAIPAAVAASRWVSGVVLIHALYVAVAAAGVLALVALGASRKARLAQARSVWGGRSRWPSVFAWAGVYAAVTGGLALAVYGALRAAS
jgi:hypothetical protein